MARRSRRKARAGLNQATDDRSLFVDELWRPLNGLSSKKRPKESERTVCREIHGLPSTLCGLPCSTVPAWQEINFRRSLVRRHLPLKNNANIFSCQARRRGMNRGTRRQ